METTQANKLKLNATSVKSFLFGSNKKLDKMQKEKKRLIEFGEKEEKFREKEKRVESPINLKSPLAAVKSFILAGPMSIFDKIKEFLGIILLGILVNNLPQIIQKIKDFFNDPFVKGTLKVLEYMGKGLYEIIKSTITFTASTQKRITEDIKKIKKDTEYLLETFGFLERDIDKDISDLQGSKAPNQKQPPTPPPPPKGSAPSARPARPVPLTQPGAPANPTPTTATQPGNNPFAQVFSKGGTVTQPKKKGETQTSRTTSFSKRESGKLKKARNDMNYFDNFNKSIKELAENTSFEDENNKIFEEMVNNFKAFADLMGISKDETPRSPNQTPSSGQAAVPMGEPIDVNPSDIVGYVGQTGRASGPHIHIETGNGYTGAGGRVPSDVLSNVIVDGLPLNSYKMGDGLYAGRNHKGFDYAMRSGAEISLRGGLKFVEYDEGDNAGYGNALIIQDKNGKPYLIGHLSRGPKNIKELKKRQQELAAQGGLDKMYEIDKSKRSQEGKASFYGGPTDPYWEGRTTASGDVFRSALLTAASNSIPLGSMVRVTNKTNGKSVVVKVNDTGGFGELGRVIDLSYAAMKKLGGISSGVINVKIERLRKKPIPKPGDPKFIGPVPRARTAQFEGSGGTRDQNAFLPLNNKETNMVAMMMTQPVIQPYPVPVPLPMKSAPAPASSGPPALSGAWSDLG